jgi:hypothetical protein
MKMTKKILGILLAAVLFAQPGCNDEAFLKEEPTTFYTIDNIFSTSEQVDQVLVSIYSHFRDLKSNVGESQWIMVLRGRGTDMYDVANIRMGDSFSNYGTINTTHDHFYQIYCTWYYVIARANLALYAAELPQITWASADNKKNVIAEAKFFRAYAHKHLAELFGGVPIVTEVAMAPRFDYERATRVATYQFAIDEMKAALSDLPETTAIGGRIVKAAAQHELSELYLAMGTQLAEEGKAGEAQAAFTSSISYASEVIDGGKYQLMNERFGKRKDEKTFAFNVYQGGSATAKIDTVQATANHYWDLFQEDNVNYQDGNRECIWAIQIDWGAFQTEDKKSRLLYARHYGPVLRDGVAGRHLQGTREDVGGRGISSTNITMYTRDLIYEGAYAADMRNSEAVFRRRFKGNVATSPYFKKDVPWEVMYDGDANPTTNLNSRSLYYPVSCKIATDKFTGVDQGQDMSHLFRDDYMIRLPETILLRAEAKQRSGDKAGAAADVNLLRARACCTYMVTAADMDDSFNTILDERARELVYEEWRWNTLLRMGGTIAVDRIKKYAYWDVTRTTLTFDYNLWPIPQTVIDTNRDVKMDQNPGWENR